MISAPEVEKQEIKGFPRDAKWSEIVRSYANGIPSHIRTHENGFPQMCAVGVICEYGGYDWSDYEELKKLTQQSRNGVIEDDEYSYLYSEIKTRMKDPYDFAGSVTGLSPTRINSLYNIFDTQGKDAAADYLESLGL